MLPGAKEKMVRGDNFGCNHMSGKASLASWVHHIIKAEIFLHHFCVDQMTLLRFNRIKTLGQGEGHPERPVSRRAQLPMQQCQVLEDEAPFLMLLTLFPLL